MWWERFVGAIAGMGTLVIVLLAATEWLERKKPRMTRPGSELHVPPERETKPQWHGWAGGICPVPQNTSVIVRLRSGRTLPSREAWSHQWQHSGSLSDIVAYRIDA